MASTQRTSLQPQRADLAQPMPPHAFGPPPRQVLDSRGDRVARDPAIPVAAPRISRQHLRETKNHKPSQRSAKKIKKKPKSRKRVFPKRNWTPEEDERLRALVKAQTGAFNWSDIARHFNQRVGKQCRERWHNHLSESLKKTEWSKEEDALLINLHSKYGNRWAFLSQEFPGRTDNMIKNRWNTTLCKKVQAGLEGRASFQSGGSRTSNNSAGFSLTEIDKGPGGPADNITDLKQMNTLSTMVLKSGPGTTTSLEEQRVDKIPTPRSPDPQGLSELSAGLVNREASERLDLAILSPLFSIRIPVINKELAGLRGRLRLN